MPQKMILLDGSNHAFRFFHAMPPMFAGKLPTSALFGFATLLRSIERKESPDFLVVVFDKGKSFRVEIDPAYKGHRPEMPEDLAAQWPLFEPIVEAWGYRCLSMEGYEADDIIGTLARRFAGPDLRVLIASSDKDFAQLVDEHVHILDLRKEEHALLGPAEVRERFGVPPDRILDLLALQGDASDNVPGVPGVGPKRALAWIEAFGDVETLIARADEIPGKVGESLRANVEGLRRAQRLVRIVTDVDLPLSLQDLCAHRRDIPALRALFQRFQFRTLLAELPAVEAPLVAEPRARVRQIGTSEDLAILLAESRHRGRLFVATLGAAGPALALCARPGEVHTLDLEANPALREPLAVALADASLPKGAHDVKALVHRLRAEGLPFEGADHDVLLADALLAPERSDRGMDALASIHLGEDARAPASTQTSLFEDASEHVEARAHRCEAALRIAALQETALREEGMLQLLHDIETPTAPVLADMERHGIRLDPEELRAVGRQIAESISCEEARIFEIVGHPFLINSPRQLAEVLFNERGLKPLRKTQTGRSTDADTLEALAGTGDPLPAAVLVYRSLSKLKSGYIDGLAQWLDPRDRRVHTTFLQTVAATGRLSSVDPNLQNIPIRTPEGRLIRRCFVPEPGCRFVSADYSQIELRILADRCGSGALVEAFLRGEDIHRRTAAEVFGVSPLLVSSEQRRAAKAINFGIVYGMGAFRLSNELGIPRSAAQRYIDAYFARYPEVKAYMEQAIAFAREHGYALTRFGRRRRIPEIHASQRPLRESGERMAINTPVQGDAAEVMKVAMIRVLRRMKVEIPSARLLLQVHDELLVECPEPLVDEVRVLLDEEMGAAVALSVPLLVQTNTGADWEACH